jgi:hypothetical protein
MKGMGGIQRKVMLPLPYWQTLQYWQGRFNLSAFVRSAWQSHRMSRKPWPLGMTLGQVTLRGTTVSLDRATADDIDAVRVAMPGLNFSRWVARSLHEAMPQHFPDLGY